MEGAPEAPQPTSEGAEHSEPSVQPIAPPTEFTAVSVPVSTPANGATSALSSKPVSGPEPADKAVEETPLESDEPVAPLRNKVTHRPLLFPSSICFRCYQLIGTFGLILFLELMLKIVGRNW